MIGKGTILVKHGRNYSGLRMFAFAAFFRFQRHPLKISKKAPKVFEAVGVALSYALDSRRSIGTTTSDASIKEVLWVTRWGATVSASRVA
jgi:hypothetical protein